MIEYLLLVLSGAFAGILGCLFGIGGGIVIVPVLYWVFTGNGVDPDTATKMAVGTSLATIIVTSIRSLNAHRQRGSVDFSVLRGWIPFISLGAIFGALVARVVSGKALLLLFAIGVIGIGLHRLFGKREGGRVFHFSPAAERALAGGTGIFSAMMGIGGGVIGVLLLTFAGRPIHLAVGTASGFGVAIAVPGAIGFALLGLGANTPATAIGYVHLPGLAAVALGASSYATVSSA